VPQTGRAAPERDNFTAHSRPHKRSYLIAYKQPITKSEIESIRGVNCDYSIQKLLEKDLIVIQGRNENAPGRPLLYNTSKSFMDYFGINDSEDLPKIREVLADQIVEPTLVNTEHFEIEEESTLVVSESGELIENLENEEGSAAQPEAGSPDESSSEENTDQPEKKDE